MQDPYMERIKTCIKSTLRDFPRTFDEIVKKCYGAYPLSVKTAMEEMNIHHKLVPLFTTQETEISPLMQDVQRDYYKSELVTFSIENNPILSNWYFSWQSCQKLSQIDHWKDKRILFLGAPRLFEYFVSHNKGGQLTLIDLDENVTKALEKKYIPENSNLSIEIQTKDINFINNLKDKYDIVFLDPPWYLESYISWLTKATKFVYPTGMIMLTMFPYLVRPSASDEREYIFKFCRSFSSSVLSIPEYLEYDIPTFEKKELDNAEIDLRSNWKVSDLLILQGITSIPDLPKQTRVDLQYQGWKEFTLLDIRWFIREPFEMVDASHNTPLLSLVGSSIYLDSPSRRNKQFHQANLQSSRGHGLFVSNTEIFINIVNDLKNRDHHLSYEAAVEKLEIDETSKKNFKLIGVE